MDNVSKGQGTTSLQRLKSRRFFFFNPKDKIVWRDLRMYPALSEFTLLFQHPTVRLPILPRLPSEALCFRKTKENQKADETPQVCLGADDRSLHRDQLGCCLHLVGPSRWDVVHGVTVSMCVHRVVVRFGAQVVAISHVATVGQAQRGEWKRREDDAGSLAVRLPKVWICHLVLFSLFPGWFVCRCHLNIHLYR